MRPSSAHPTSYNNSSSNSGSSNANSYGSSSTSSSNAGVSAAARVASVAPPPPRPASHTIDLAPVPRSVHSFDPLYDDSAVFVGPQIHSKYLPSPLLPFNFNNNASGAQINAVATAAAVGPVAAYANGPHIILRTLNNNSNNSNNSNNINATLSSSSNSSGNVCSSSSSSVSDSGFTSKSSLS